MGQQWKRCKCTANAILQLWNAGRKNHEIFFRNLDWDAVDYLIAQVENTEEQAQRSDGDLMISGRVQGGVRLVAAVCILAAVLFVNIYFRTQGLPPIIYVPPVVLAVTAFLCWWVIICSTKFWFKRTDFTAEPTPLTENTINTAKFQIATWQRWCKGKVPSATAPDGRDILTIYIHWLHW